MLPLTTAAFLSNRTRCSPSASGWLNNINKLRLGVALFDLDKPATHQISRRSTRNKNHPSIETGNSGTTVGQRFNSQGADYLLRANIHFSKAYPA
jgi:hypothetical protein